MHSFQLFRAVYYIRWSEKQQLTCENWNRDKCLTNGIFGGSPSAHLNLGDLLHSSSPANIFVLKYITISLLPKNVFIFVQEMFLLICASVLSLKNILFYECFSFFWVIAISTSCEIFFRWHVFRWLLNSIIILFYKTLKQI